MTDDSPRPQTDELDLVARAAARQREAAAARGGIPPLAPWMSPAFHAESHAQPALPFESPAAEPDTVPADVDLTAHRVASPQTPGLDEPEIPPGVPDLTGMGEPDTAYADESGWFDDDLDAMPVPQRPSLFQRLRDAIAVQVALRRGAPDDEVEIVSGLGAIPARARPGSRRPVAADSEPVVSDMAPDSLAPAEPDPPIFEEFHPAPAFPVVEELPVTRYEEPALSDAAATPHGPTEALPDVAVTQPRAPLHNFPKDALRNSVSSPLRAERGALAVDEDEPEGEPRTPLADRVGQTVGRARAVALAGFAAAAARRPRVDTGTLLSRMRNDSRTALAAAMVLVLLALGLLTGKHDTKLSGSAVLANTAPTAPVQPVTQPSAPAAGSHSAPPAPAAPTAAPGGKPMALNNPQTLGSGASGFDVKDIRYGIHPNDYRIVFDLTGPNAAAGTPGTVIGFSDPTTMVVVLNQVGSSPNTGALPAGVVTSVSLQPSSTPGQTVYIFKLARPVTVQAAYVGGPTRLVIDLN